MSYKLKSVTFMSLKVKAITLDCKKWNLDTKAHSNNNQAVSMSVHTGSDVRNKPVSSQKRRVFYYTKKDQYLVAFINKSEQVPVEENTISIPENQAQDNQPCTTLLGCHNPILLHFNSMD
jgi:hypothetical protein